MPRRKVRKIHKGSGNGVKYGANPRFFRGAGGSLLEVAKEHYIKIKMTKIE